MADNYSTSGDSDSDNASGRGHVVPKRSLRGLTQQSKIASVVVDKRPKLSKMAAPAVEQLVQQVLDKLNAQGNTSPPASSSAEDHARDTVMEFMRDEEGTSTQDQPVDDFRQFAERLDADEQVGPDLPDSLAEVLGRLLEDRLTDQQFKNLGEKELAPGNVTLLAVPKVPGTVWAELSRDARSTDVKLQGVQGKMIKTLILLGKLCGEIKLVKNDVSSRDLSDKLSDLIAMGLNTFQLGAAALHDCSQKRRELLKPDLNPEFKAICNVPEKEGDSLFGPGLEEKIKDLAQSRSLGRKVIGRQTRRPYFQGPPHPRSRGSGPMQSQTQRYSSSPYPSSRGYSSRYNSRNLRHDSFRGRGVIARGRGPSRRN